MVAAPAAAALRSLRDGTTRMVVVARADDLTAADLSIGEALQAPVPRVLGGFTSERTFQLMHLYVPPTARGEGLALALLHRLAHVLREDGCRRIELDDMSDRYRAGGNVYIRAGFDYCRTDGPEMAATPRRVLARRSGG